MREEIILKAKLLIGQISECITEEKIELINEVKKLLHSVSPFQKEPVDCVLWVKSDKVRANDYNPNSVAPPEMKLLHLSIKEDGYTQPIVTMEDGEIAEVIDGFHRHRVGKEYDDVRERVLGYLPLVYVNSERTDKENRIASTVRHNRARGKHRVDAMSEIVMSLKKRNWSDEKIGRELGMDADEVLRLAQITGLAEAFQDKEFSEAWEAENIQDEEIKIDG